MKLPWGAAGRMQEGNMPTPCSVCNPKLQGRSKLHTITLGYKPGCSNTTGKNPNSGAHTLCKNISDLYAVKQFIFAYA